MLCNFRLLPREDINLLLKTNGDFLVRTTEIAGNGNRQVSTTSIFQNMYTTFIISTLSVLSLRQGGQRKCGTLCDPSCQQQVHVDRRRCLSVHQRAHQSLHEEEGILWKSTGNPQKTHVSSRLGVSSRSGSFGQGHRRRSVRPSLHWKGHFDQGSASS